MPEDLELSQIGSSQLPLPFRGLRSPGVRKHCQIIFACYFRKSSNRLSLGICGKRRVSGAKREHSCPKLKVKHDRRWSPRGSAQELCESRGRRPGLFVLMSLTFTVDVKQHSTVLRHWSQFVPNMSADIRGH